MSLLKRSSNFFIKVLKLKKEKDISIKQKILFEDILLDILVNVPYDIIAYKKYTKGLYKNFNFNLDKKQKFFLAEHMMAMTYDVTKHETISKYFQRKYECVSESFLAYSIILNAKLPKKLYNNYFYSFLIRERYSEKYGKFYKKMFDFMEKKMLITDNMLIINTYPTRDENFHFNSYWDMFTRKEKLEILASKKRNINFRNYKIIKLNATEYKKTCNSFDTEQLDSYEGLKFLLIIKKTNHELIMKEDFFIYEKHFDDLRNQVSKNKIFEIFCLNYNFVNFKEDTVNKFEEAYNRLKDRKYLPLVDIENI